jgi:hypothetical protein
MSTALNTVILNLHLLSKHYGNLRKEKTVIKLLIICFMFIHFFHCISCFIKLFGISQDHEVSKNLFFKCLFIIICLSAYTV